MTDDPFLVVRAGVVALAALAAACATPARATSADAVPGEGPASEEARDGAPGAGEPAEEPRHEVLQILDTETVGATGGELSERAVQRIVDLGVALWGGVDLPLDAFAAWFEDAETVVLVTDGEPGPVARALRGRLGLVLGEDAIVQRAAPAGGRLPVPDEGVPTIYVLRPRWDGGSVRMGTVDPATRDAPWPIFADLVGRPGEPSVGCLLVGTHDALHYASRVSLGAAATGSLPNTRAIALEMEFDADSMIWDRFVAPSR